MVTGYVGKEVQGSISGMYLVTSTCEYGNEPSGSIKYGEFLD
jgi:hypothetical protein